MMVMRQFEKSGLRLTPPDFPPRVQLEITNRCNLRCIMCTRNQMTRPTGDMAVEIVKKVADEVSRETGTVLCLYFLGEPLLHKGLEEMISYINSVNNRSPIPFVYGIQTNAMLLDRQRAHSLLQAGLKSYAISLDGLAGDLERVRPGASYSRVERNILDLIDEAEKMGIDDLVIDITKLCDDTQAPEVKKFLEVWQPRVRQVHLIGISKVEGNAYMSSDGSIKKIDTPGRSVGRKYCNQGQRILIHWDGQFAFCCSDVDGGIKLGSIHDRSIREVWNSPEIQAVRHKIMHEDYRDLAPCATCSHSHSYAPPS
jgi:radical SAM protein with 4Fe4S-binding SPASM domain